MERLTFGFKKDADLDAIAAKVSEFFAQCPSENAAMVKVTIREGDRELTHWGWNSGQNPPPHEVAHHIADFILQYTRGKDDHFLASATVFFPPKM